MGSRREQRPVTEMREVDVAECDNCQKATEFQSELQSHPDGWFVVVSGLRLEAMVCSRECLQQWASGSSELTALARERFKQATS